MSFGIAEVFLGLAVALYIYMLLDRICKCFESCSQQKAIGNAYAKINPDIFKSILEKMKEK